MTPKAFRRIALTLEGAVDGAHMAHPDFRVGKRIFASIHSKDQFGMVKLTPDQQKDLVDEYPDMFAAESGAWGRSGYTRVVLSAADENAVGEALTMAWQNTRKAVPKKGRWAPGAWF